MSDTERIDKLEERVEQFKNSLGFIEELARAVEQAADRGDALAVKVSAGSAKGIVENLIAHFEAVAKREDQG